MISDRCVPLLVPIGTRIADVFVGDPAAVGLWGAVEVLGERQVDREPVRPNCWPSSHFTMLENEQSQLLERLEPILNLARSRSMRQTVSSMPAGSCRAISRDNSRYPGCVTSRRVVASV